MPELPEVENVKLSLERQGLSGQVFSNVELRRPDLRTPLSPVLRSRLPGQRILRLERRAKYLLLHTEDYTLLSHLGMSGSWRFVDAEGELQKHDHVILGFESGKKLVFNDPRRFGIFEMIRHERLKSSRWLKHLGPEPLSRQFSVESLFIKTRGRKAPIKAFLMDQRHVVGVGNIYASEALFSAGIRPSRPAGRITRDEAGRLVRSIRAILGRAIRAGGSTIRNYRNSVGEKGRFQTRFLVYDRAGEPCVVCRGSLKAKVIAGRSTFWCQTCQR
jgi:formamidopyrimidine-DNA glycosylase